MVSHLTYQSAKAYQRQLGIGRKLKTGSVPKCEKHWYIVNKDSQQKRLLLQKEKFIKILAECNYKVTDENCEKKSESRMHHVDYRRNWKPSMSDKNKKVQSTRMMEGKKSDDDLHTAKSTTSKKSLTIVSLSSTNQTNFQIFPKRELLMVLHVIRT